MKSILVSLCAFGLLACASHGAMSGSGDDDDGGFGSGDDTVTAADKQQDYDDVANMIGQNTQTGELAAMVDVVQIAYVQTPAGFETTGANQLLGMHGDVQYSYSWYCRDAVDMVDIVCDGHENHVHIQVDFTGDMTTPAMTLAGFDRSAKWTVRDVSVNEPRVDGPGHVMFTSELATGSYDIDFDDTYTRVRFTTTPTVPTSGTMDLTVNVQRSKRDGSPDRKFSTMAHLDFTTAPASLVLDGIATYAADMTTGAVTKK